MCKTNKEIPEYKYRLPLRNTLGGFVDSWNNDRANRRTKLTEDKISKDIGISPQQVVDLLIDPALLPSTEILFNLCDRYESDITAFVKRTYPLELEIAITATRQDEEPDRLLRLEDMLENAYQLGGLDLLAKINSVHDHKGQLVIDWKSQPTSLDMRNIEYAWETQAEYLVEHTLNFELIEHIS